MQQASRLAIYALIELARDPSRQVTVSEIGEKFRVSAHHLAKVMNRLGQAGLVKSIRGVGGGYSFSGNARRTTLLDVIRLFEDVSVSAPDEDSSGATSVERALSDVTAEINEIINATYGSITLATMLKHVARHDLQEAPGKPAIAQPDTAEYAAT